MTYNPMITAARREAKRRARETGASYQSMLDETAQRAGRSDWEMFLTDPAPLRSQNDLSAEDVVKTEPPIAVGIQLAERQGDRPAQVMSRKRLHPALVFGMPLVAGLAMMVTPTVGVGRAISLDYERRSIATLRLPTLHANGDRNVYVAAWRGPDERRDVLVTAIDNRPLEAWSSRFDRILLWTRMKLTSGPVNAYLYASHPVIRARYDVDCRRRTWMLTDVQAADDFTSAPAYSFKAHGSRSSQTSPRPLTDWEAKGLCSPDVLRRTDRLVRRRSSPPS